MDFLPPEDLSYLENKKICFDQHEDDGQKGIIIKNWHLPEELYDVEVADLLIIIPQGYPDVHPDMFHLIPWVKLRNGNKYPKAADQPVMFKGQEWQRWSRHNNEWRPGIDGIWIMLKLVEHALLVAA